MCLMKLSRLLSLRANLMHTRMGQDREQFLFLTWRVFDLGIYSSLDLDLFERASGSWKMGVRSIWKRFTFSILFLSLTKLLVGLKIDEAFKFPKISNLFTSQPWWDHLFARDFWTTFASIRQTWTTRSFTTNSYQNLIYLLTSEEILSPLKFCTRSIEKVWWNFAIISYPKNSNPTRPSMKALRNISKKFQNNFKLRFMAVSCF